MGASEEETLAALDQLVGWGNLQSYHDTAEVATLADFHRRKLLYQLTAAGEAAQRAAVEFLNWLGRPIALEAEALERIHALLGELSQKLDSADRDAGRLTMVLRQIATDAEQLTAQAQGFFRWLHVQTFLRGVDLESFLRYKEKLIDYLQRFLAELALQTGRIAAQIDALEPRAEEFLQIAAEQEAAVAFARDDAERQSLVVAARARQEQRWRGLRRWFVGIDGDPQVKQLRAAASAVIERIPLKVPMSLTQLAAETCGDSHALDRDSSLGRLTNRALAALQSQSPARSAAEIRTLWANVGVVLDELSATVLVLNLPTLPGSALGDMLYPLRQAGEPARLTFRQLRGNAPCDFDAAGAAEVFVCENPAVVAAAADRWGADCRPLICVEGQPNLAAERVLQMLVERGISLRYHGDFDWGGIRIAAHLWKRFRFTPWRFTCDDYVQAPPGRTLSGQPIATPWDDRLGLTMQAAAVIVHEEALLEQLLADLRPAAHMAGPRA